MKTEILLGVSVLPVFKTGQPYILGASAPYGQLMIDVDGDARDLWSFWHAPAEPIQFHEIPGNKHAGVLVIPSVSTPEGINLMGATVDPAGAERVFEIHGYGLILLDSGAGQVNAVVGRRGDKVFVPKGAMATLLNLDGPERPLVVIRVGRPTETAPASGPILVGVADTAEILLKLNQSCVFPQRGRGGIVTREAWTSENRTVRIPNDSRISLGYFLHTQLTTNSKVISGLDRLRIHVLPGTPELELPQAGLNNPVYCRLPLIRLEQESALWKRFWADNQPSSPGSSELLKAIDDCLSRRARLVEGSAGFRNITVEGLGNWARTAYLPALKETPVIAATFTYDSDYGDSPEWAADDADFRFIDKANPDSHQPLDGVGAVALVVTPDVTHMPVAASWVGRVPLLICEKPFAAEYRQIDQLTEALALANSKTAVFGVDHYLLRLASARDLRETIREIFQAAGQIKEIVFTMTEARPLSERFKTLQFGVGLDMLPHGFALLTLLGSIESFDDLKIIARYRHNELPEWFQTETGMEIEGSMRLFTGKRVRIRMVVAKGWMELKKRLEIIGDANVVLDFTSNKLSLGKKEIPVPDTVHAYRWLLDGIYSGLKRQHSWGLLSLVESATISKLLDHMWQVSRRVTCVPHTAGAMPEEK